MSVLKYKAPTTGAWIATPSVKVITEYVGGSAIGVPSDIVTEADRVVSSIKTKITSNSVNFIAMSDMHELGDNDQGGNTTIIERYRRANRNAGQGAKLIAEKINPDFFVNLGDLAWGASNTTLHDWAQSVTNAKGYTASIEALTECFYTPGNHDSGYPNGDYDENLVTGMIGNYRYKDLTDKKVRVICLNTADNTDGVDSCERVSGTQLQWFANALDLSDKSNASKWGIIILSHHPLDWGAILPAANCLQAYITGANYSVTHNGVAVSKDFSSKNAAKIICQFHGHVHGFLVDNIRYGSAGSLKTMDVKRIAIPNACFDRTNEYGENTTVDFSGMEFGETSSHEKADNGTGKNTAFCVVSIDLDRKIIYAECFGAGYDRVVSYGDAEMATYSVTNTLSYATNSNGTETITEGTRYSAAITPSVGYELDVITVTMGGVDITSVAVYGSDIIIEEVTGDIVITVTTIESQLNYTNRVRTSIDEGGNVYNGTGYQEGCRLNSSGTTSESSGAVNCGFVPYNGQVIRVYGTTSSNHTNNGNYVIMYKSDFSVHTVQNCDNWISYGAVYSELDGKYMLTIDPAQITNAATKAALKEAAYIRASMAACTGANFVVTLDEPIE